MTGLLVAGCSNPIVESFTGVDFVKTYSPEQKAAYRAAVSLSIKALNGNATDKPTAAEWEEMYDYAEATCDGIDENGREWVQGKMIDQITKFDPTADSAGAARVADVFINAAIAQGSFCPSAAG